MRGAVVVGFSGAVAIAGFETARITLERDYNMSGAALWLLLVAVLLSMYGLTFVLVDGLDRKLLWRLTSSPSLAGSYSLWLKNLEDDSERVGTVEIRQDRDSIEISGINHRIINDVDYEIYSTWRSRTALLAENALFLVYEVESSRDVGQHFKRGVMLLRMPSVSQSSGRMIGDYYDVAPSSARGPVHLTRMPRAK